MFVYNDPEVTPFAPMLVHPYFSFPKALVTDILSPCCFETPGDISKAWVGCLGILMMGIGV